MRGEAWTQAWTHSFGQSNFLNAAIELAHWHMGGGRSSQLGDHDLDLRILL